MATLYPKENTTGKKLKRAKEILSHVAKIISFSRVRLPGSELGLQALAFLSFDFL